MQLEHVRFVGSAGAELAGVVRRPPGEVVGSALIAHCFTCGKDLHTTARLSKALTRAGWLTMTFDFTGIGESGGDFGDTTVGTEVGASVGAPLVLGASVGARVAQSFLNHETASSVPTITSTLPS